MHQKAENHALLRAVLPEALLLAAAALALGLTLFLPLALAHGETAEEALLWRAYRRGEVIRLHVIANDDGEEAQRVKLAVRDALLRRFGAQLARAGERDAQAVYAMLLAGVEDMREAARQCARENGFEGSVAAEVGALWMPERRYGAVTLPEGVYRGLRVTLGNGSGKNWWCVLFPSLCLAVADDGDGPNPSDTPEEEPVVWNCERIFHLWPAVDGKSGRLDSCEKRAPFRF